jgi:hypothetical protein
MRERIGQTGLIERGKAIPECLDEIGWRLLQHPEAEIVLDDVSRDPNPEDLTLQHGIEHAIPDVIRSGGSRWSLPGDP